MAGHVHMHRCDPDCRGIMESDQQQIGQTLQFTREGNAKTIIDPRGESQGTSVVTIALGAAVDFRTPTADVGARVANLIARIEFGSGAGNAVVEVDWRNGSVISVPASSVRVSAVSLDQGNDLAFENSNLSAFIAWGSRGGGATRATRTIPNLAVTAAAPVIIPVPNFAWALKVYENLVTPITTIVYLAGPAATDLALGAYANGGLASIAPDGLILPGACRFVLITTTADRVVTPVFSLMV